MFQVFKDALVEIKNRLSQFISIALIIMLGVGFLIGLRIIGENMRLTGDGYYKSNNLMDYRLISTLGFDDESIESIKATNLFETVEGAYSLDVLAHVSNKEYNIKLLSYDKDSQLNKFVLVAGELPKNSQEILVDSLLNRLKYLQVGDIVTIDDKNIKQKSFKVVGFIHSPMYITFERGFSSIGSGKSTGYFYIPIENFDLEAYTEVFTYNDHQGSYFDDKYQDLIDAKTSTLDNFLPAIKSQRLAAVKAPYEEKIAKANKELKQAENDYKEAISKAEKKLSDALLQINQGESQLLDGYNLYLTNLGLETITKNDSNLITYELFHSLTYQKTIDTIEFLNNQINQGLANGTILPGSTEHQELLTKVGMLNSIFSSYDSFKASAVKLDEATKTYLAGLKTLNVKKLEGQSKIDKAKSDLNKAQKDLDKVALPDIYVQNRNNNPGYSGLKADSERIEAIGQLIPLIFFIVAALVCLSSVSRMVDEHRQEIGTYKALGYSSRAISIKYLMFAGLSTAIGIILGLFIGYDFLPQQIFNAYNSMYILPPMSHSLASGYLILPVFLTILVGPVLALFTVLKHLRSVPAALMRPLAAKPGKRVLLERVSFIWRRLKFLQKISVRNIFRNKSRMIMTIIGIAGCSGLLVVGFGLNHSVMSIAEKQFNNISISSGIVGYKVKDEQTSQELLTKVRDNQLIKNSSNIYTKEVDASANGLIFISNFELYEDSNDVNAYFNLINANNKDKLLLNDQGVIINVKLADLLNIKVGDTFQIFDRNSNLNLDVRVSGICENYFPHYIFMSRNYYDSLTRYPLDNNAIIFNLVENTELNQNKFASEIIKDDQVLIVNYASTLQKSFNDMMGSFKNIIYIIIAASALLAFIVLYNLGNMNISERQRELATVQVLGFNLRETYTYIDRESLILCSLGIIFGLGFGKILHQYVITTVEIDQVMFNRELIWSAYVYAVVLSLVFFWLTNIVLHRKIRKIELVSALKSVE